MKKIFLASFCMLATIASYAQLSKTHLTKVYTNQATQFGLKASDVENFVVTDQYTDSKTGITHVYLRQVVNGIEVFNANSSLHFKGEQLISIQNGFVVNATAKTNVSEAHISTVKAIQIAGAETEIAIVTAMSKADVALTKWNQELTIIEPTVSEEPIKAKIYYIQTTQGLVLSYNIELFNNVTNDWWNVRVDASNGEVLEKNNWTTFCNVSPLTFAEADHLESTTNVMASKAVSKKASGTNGAYNVFPFPVESPNHGLRTIVSGSVAKSNASPYGWHDTNGAVGAEFTTTKGNNVFADEDTLASNQTGYSPDGGDSLIFDYPLDSGWLDYGLYLNASITQLFYANNVLHDVFYQYGFDEVAGNYQFNNYGKGGLDGDQVNADAQDGSGTGNANFSAPSDGSSGRMQMYLWPTTSVASVPLTISGSTTANGNYTAPLSTFGAKRFADLTAEVILVDDGSNADSLGCGTLQNSAALAGKIALIYRGTCGLSGKVLNAQNAGAIGVIMIHNSTSTLMAMSGGNSAVTIPSVIVSKNDGAKIKAALDNGDTVVATMQGQPLVKAFDSDFDNGVMAHEFGHGISIRLTGGPSNSNCLSNAEQGGEGWSDFFALALTAKVGDKGTDGKGIGTFVYNQSPSALGIREFRYSTNMSTNPMTYNYIKNNKGVHYTGTIWCTMLWEMYWGLVDKYGFDEDIYNGTGGNNKAIQLVIDGLKLQPCNPGFVDARDAIIKADSLNNGGANKAIIWTAFAKRGLGFSAKQGSSNSLSDGTTSFDLPSELTTGLSPVEDLSRYISVRPNPTEGLTHLVLPDQLKEAMVTVTDIAGKVVFSGSKQTDLNQHILLDLSGHANGIYFVKVVSGVTSFQSKIIVAK
jgi:extracellular elastinolytic metalloproteinase